MSWGSVECIYVAPGHFLAQLMPDTLAQRTAPRKSRGNQPGGADHMGFWNGIKHSADLTGSADINKIMGNPESQCDKDRPPEGSRDLQGHWRLVTARENAVSQTCQLISEQTRQSSLQI